MLGRFPYAFLSLCIGQAAPPGYRFRPLDMVSEPPCPGMVLAIDAEFVTLTPVADNMGGGASLLGMHHP